MHLPLRIAFYEIADMAFDVAVLRIVHPLFEDKTVKIWSYQGYYYVNKIRLYGKK